MDINQTRKSDDDESVYDPAITHSTVGSWNYIVFHDDEHPVEPKQQVGFSVRLTVKGQRP